MKETTLMLMYREFRSNLGSMNINDIDANVPGIYVPTFVDMDIKKNSLKMTRFRSSSRFEKAINPLKILLIFPERSYQIKNISSTYDTLKIKFDSTWSVDETLQLLSNNSYDIIVVDRRPYDIGNLDVDQLVVSIRRDITKSTFKIISFSDRVFEDYNKLWEQGYDEQWVNYNDACALKNYLASYLRNQFMFKSQLKKTSLWQNVFDKFIDSVAILTSEFNIESINRSFQTNFKSSPSEIVGINWFSFHRISEEKMKLIINEVQSKSIWSGLVICEEPCINALQMNVVIMLLDAVTNYYVVYISNISLRHSRSDNSLSLISFDRDTMASNVRNKETFLGHSQISVDSPILKIMKIINYIEDGANSTISHQLQKIVEILSSKDLFITTIDALRTDKMSSSLIDGLLANNATIMAQTETRRHTSSFAKRRHTRDNSEVIHDHINQVLAKIGKIPEMPENDDVNELEELLVQHTSWSFDILRLEKLCDFKPLRHLGMKIFAHFNMSLTLKVDAKLFENWLYIMESNYNDSNSYHNSTHAADVLQSSAWFLERDRINEIFDGFDDTISIIAAIIHDLGHPGRTNPFLINTNNNLAVLYNDIAVLENHHAAFAFKLTLKDERINIFKNVDSDDYRVLRHGIIDAVLATEMAKHFEHLTKFSNNIVKRLDYHDVSQETNLTYSLNGIEQQPVDSMTLPHNKALIRRMLIKCSDVNNPTRPFPLSEQWAKRISEEYFNQTDDEIARKIPVVMPQFNRTTCDIPKSQITFIEIFLEDMFAMWHEFADTGELITNLQENKESWKALIVGESEEIKTAEN